MSINSGNNILLNNFMMKPKSLISGLYETNDVIIYCF